MKSIVPTVLLPDPVSSDGAAADRVEVGGADHVAETAGLFRENAEGHTKHTHPNDIEMRRDTRYRSDIDIGFTKHRCRSPQSLMRRCYSSSPTVQPGVLLVRLLLCISNRVCHFGMYSLIFPYMSTSDRRTGEVILAFAFGDMGVLMRVEKLQGVQSNVKFAAQRRKSFDLGFPFLDYA